MRRDFYKGKLAVITGAASGLGEALASELLVKGAKVAYLDRDEEKLKQISNFYVKELNEGKIFTRCIDVTNEESTRIAIEDIWDDFGAIDFLFNNAGVLIAGEVRDLTPSHFRELLDVNMMGVVHSTLPVYRLMVERGKGCVVNIASVSGISSNPLFSAYSASKHALVGLSKALREEGKDLGVKVTAVCPSTLRTRMLLTGRVINAPQESVFKDSILAMTPVETAAKIILEKLPSNPSLIVFPLHAKIFWYLEILFPWMLSRINQKILANYRRFRLSKPENCPN